MWRCRATGAHGCKAVTQCDANNEYEHAPPTRTSDRVCHDVLACDASTEYETQAPSQSSNRACAACPVGARCAGGDHLPVALPGYWLHPLELHLSVRAQPPRGRRRPSALQG